MIQLVEATNIPDAWFQCLRLCQTVGRRYIVGKGTGEGLYRLELPTVAIEISHPEMRPLAPPVPDGVLPPTNNEFIEQYLYYLMSPDKQQNEEYTYGEDISKQIEELLRVYPLWGPDSNRYCMMVGGPDSLFQYRREGTHSSAHSQCLRVVDLRIIDGVITTVLYFRSWDLWGGFPTNLGGIQLMMEAIAKALGLQSGPIHAMSKGLHIYQWAFEQAERALSLPGLAR